MFAKRQSTSAPLATHALRWLKRRVSAVVQPAADRIRPERTGPSRVLIADDNRDDRMLMARYLSRADLQVIEASSGDEVLGLFHRHQPDAVVLDLLMPHGGGLSICQILREQPGGGHLPIILVSGLNDPGTVHRALNAGATDFMPKPAAGVTLQGYAALAERIMELLRPRASPAANESE